MLHRLRILPALLLACLLAQGLQAAQLGLPTLAQMRQSSNGSPTSLAGLAVDGNTSTLATTANQTNAWWEAELPVPYSLTRVELVNPASGVAARFTGMIVRIQDIRDQTVFQTTVTATAAGATWAVDLPAGLKGRILRVGLENGGANGAGDRVVSLAEARLFGDPILIPSSGPLQLSYSVIQSSELGGYPASNGLDGNAGSFTHTANTPNSYWQITYSQNIPIQRIEVVNRAGCCPERLAGLVLRVLDDSNNTVATTTLHNPGDGGTVTFTPPAGTRGRSVKIGLEGGATNGGGNYYVTVAEVRVISTVVSQSTSHPSYPASYALDGNITTFTHTDATTPNNWWQYDMGQTRSIDRVEVVNRVDCCNNRLTGLVLRIQDSNQVTVATTTLVDAGAGQTVTFDPPPGTNGRYIRIGLEGGQRNGGGGYEVTLAEVRVIEEGASVGGTPSLATGKPSYMVRLQDTLPPAANANDGNFSTSTQTTSHSVDAYWEVDLGQEYALYQVTTTAAAGLSFNLNKTTTRLYDTDHGSVFARKNTSANEVFETLTDGPRKARYVRVGLENKVRTTTDGNVGWYLGWKEVEVFGKPLSEVGILTYSAAVTNLLSGQSSALSWTVTDVREVHLEPGIGSVGASTATNGVGSLLVTPAASTEYVLIATNGCGVSFQAITMVVDGQELPPVLSEFMAANRYTLDDGDGSASDWIEIHNPRNTPLDLAGYGLSDNAAQPFLWTMPSVVVPAHGFLVVFASSRATPVDPAGNLHAPFKLSATGGDLVLTAPGGVVADQILGYPAQREDLAYGRTLGGQLRFLDPSPRQFNRQPSYEGWLQGVTFSEPRGYKTAPFTLTLTTPDAGAQILYSTTGVEPNLSYSAPLSVTSTRSVRATTARAGYKPPLVETRTYIYVDDVITSPTMNTTITQNPAYTTRLRTGLNELLTLSITIPVTPVDYVEQKGAVELIFPGSTNTVHANCGVLRFANAWSNFTKRSFRLKFRAEYGESKLRAPIYGGYERGWEPIDEFDELDVRSGSQDMVDRGFYMATIFADDSMNDMGSINPHGRFVNLYLNGAYYGKFHVRERLIDRFLADYLGGSVDDYVTVRGNDNVGDTFIPGTADPEKRFAWETARSLRTNYTQVQPHLDVDHLTDFLLLWWYGNSESEYRSTGPVAPGSGFKFYLSDPDGFLRAGAGDRTANAGPGGFFGALVAQNDPDFKMRVADRIYKHFFHDGAMTPARMSARLNARMAQITNAMVAECARWNYRNPANWEQAATDIHTTLFAPRTAQLLGYLRTRGLYPAIDAPEFSQHGGAVSPGYVPVLTAGTGTIYYTLDGSDPRLPGGAISPTALVWSAGAVTVNDDTRFKVRLRNGTTWSALNDVTFVRAGRVPATAANTLLTEVHYNPDSAGGSEFVELMNTSTNRTDFTNVRFTNGITFTFPAGFALDPGQFVVLVEDPSLFAAFYQTPGLPWYQAGLTVLGPYGGKLANGGEAVALVASNNTSIASFAYDTDGLWPSRADGGGSALELRDAPGTPSTQPARDAALGTASAWRSSILRHGTPGRLDTSLREVVIHEALSHTDAGEDWIELHNRGAGAVDVSGTYLTDSDSQPFRHQLPPGSVIPPGGFLGFDATQLGFGFSELGSDILLLEGDGTNVVRYLDTVDIPAMEREETAGVYVRSDGVLDFTELRAATRNAANALPRVGPLVISEIHYQPAAGDAEFVEIVNLTNAPVPLFDPAHATNTWELTDAVEYRFPQGITVPAGGVILVCNTNAAAFRAQTGLSPSIPVFGPWTGSLNNSGENLKLRRPGEPEPSGLVPYYRVDRVVYQPTAPWPAMPATGGVSIVRHTLQAYGNDPGSWMLSGPEGTPGALPPNHPPALAVTGSTTVPAGSTLSLTLGASDIDSPWQSHVIQVPNPPPGASFLPGTGVFTWTPSESMSPQLVPVEIVVADNGLPFRSTTNTVNITITEPFRVQVQEGTGNSLTFATLIGESYEVYYTDSLIPVNWQLLFTEPEATSTSLTVLDPAAPALNRRYYRVQWMR